MNINTYDNRFNDFLYLPILNLHDLRGMTFLWVTIFMFQLLLEVDIVSFCELNFHVNGLDIK